MRMPFGKYANWEISSVPADYHVWLWTYVPLGDPELKEAVRQEILASGVHDQIPQTSVNGVIRPPAFGYGYAPPPRQDRPIEEPKTEQRVETIY